MINTKRLRCTIGWLGMALPWMVLLLSLLYGFGFPNSISATYFHESCIAPFMIILGSAGILLCCYEGYEKIDDIVCLLAGLFGCGICLFPCAPFPDENGILRDNNGIVGTFQLDMTVSYTIHMMCAFAFFGLLAFNSLFLFTKTSGEMTENKKKRNIIFRVCGVGMVGSFLMLLLPIPNIIWIVETIALAFFGISWLTKANCYPWLFADKT